MPGGIVVIGASWGGLQALTTLVSGFQANFPFPLVVVQHRSRDSTSALAELLQDVSKLKVCEVEDKAPIVDGHVHIAPPDYHLLVDSGSFSLSTEAPLRYSRPSIDITFESVALAYNELAIGVVLTGANQDGAEGLRTIVARRGIAIVQEPDTAESPTMPRAALKAVPTAKVLPIDEMAAYLTRLAVKRQPESRASQAPSLGRSA